MRLTVLLAIGSGSFVIQSRVQMVKSGVHIRCLRKASMQCSGEGKSVSLVLNYRWVKDEGGIRYRYEVGRHSPGACRLGLCLRHIHR